MRTRSGNSSSISGTYTSSIGALRGFSCGEEPRPASRSSRSSNVTSFTMISVTPATIIPRCLSSKQVRVRLSTNLNEVLAIIRRTCVVISASCALRELSSHRIMSAPASPIVVRKYCIPLPRLRSTCWQLNVFWKMLSYCCSSCTRM